MLALLVLFFPNYHINYVIKLQRTVKYGNNVGYVALFICDLLHSELSSLPLLLFFRREHPKYDPTTVSTIMLHVNV